MRKSIAILIALASLGAVACGSKSEQAAPESVSGISVETVRLAPVDDTLDALGSVQSTTMATLSTKMMGNVTSVLVSEGDRVHKDQLLMTIDDRDTAAQARKAAAGMAEVENAIAGADAARQAAASQAQLATATYNRYLELKKRGSVSPQEFDEVEARYKGAVAQKEGADRMYGAMLDKRAQAKADSDAATAMVSWTRITSPVDGVVTSKRVDVGDQAAPGMPLMTVEDTGSYRVEANLGESRIGSIKVGAPVQVYIEALKKEITGTVVHVSPALDPMGRNYLVKVSLPATEGLTSGLTARARFSVGKANAITVPRAAIVDQGQLVGVWAVDAEGVARLRFVKTGRELGDRIEILSGLGDGERVVSATTPALRDGVKVAEADAKQKGSQS